MTLKKRDVLITVYIAGRFTFAMYAVYDLLACGMTYHIISREICKKLGKILILWTAWT